MDKSSLCIVLERLEGGELFELLASEGALSEGAAQIFFAQVVLAVEHMHSNGFCHRDLKAENICLAAAAASDDEEDDEEDELQRCALIDFGSSARLDAPITGLFATAHYVAPEVLISERAPRRQASIRQGM